MNGFTGSIAGRHDYNDPFADQDIYKLGFRQQLPLGLYVRASGGTSYSAPKIDEIGAYGASNNLNPDLEVQSVEALNIGAGIDGEPPRESRRPPGLSQAAKVRAA